MEKILDSAGHGDLGGKIRIMIAGDNPSIAHETSLIVQTADPDWEIVDVCLSGRETIDKASVLQPDIILIDLNIRGISGLDTIQVIRGINPDISFIILSANKNFDSISKAMKLGVSDYLTGQLNQKQLLSSIQKITSAIVLRKEASRREAHNQERLEAALRIIKKEYIKVLWQNSAGDRRLITYAYFLGVAEQSGFMIAILRRKNTTAQLLEGIIYRLSTLFELIGASVQPSMAVAFIPTTQDRVGNRRAILKELDNLLNHYQKDNEHIISGVGNTYSNALQMRTSLLQALSAVNYIEAVKTTYKNVIVFDEKSMTLPVENSGKAEFVERIVPSIKMSLEHAINFMETNYHMELTLADVAASVNLSPYYFSRTFKKYTGENFSRTLLNIRIRKAKQLLADKNNSIKKVAYQVGFSDPSYFSKVFHNETGIKASEYTGSDNNDNL